MTKTQLYLRVLAKRWREMGHKTAADVALHIANNEAEFAERRGDDTLKVIPAARTPAVVAERFKTLRPGEPMAHAMTAATGSGYFLNFGVTHDGGETYHSFGGYFSPKDTATLLHRMTKEGTANAAETLADKFGSDAKPGRRPKLDTSEPAEEGTDWRPNEMLPEDYHSYGRKRRYSHQQFQKAMLASPKDPTPALVYADYIEETQGHGAAADLIRKSIEQDGKHAYAGTDLSYNRDTPPTGYMPPPGGEVRFGSPNPHHGGYGKPGVFAFYNRPDESGLPAKEAFRTSGPQVWSFGVRLTPAEALEMMNRLDRDGTPHNGDHPQRGEETRRQAIADLAELHPDVRGIYSRKRRYARYSEVASHPEVLGLMRFSPDHHAGSLEHGVLADRIEELGFPTIAGHIRSAKAVSPRPYLITGMSLEPTMSVQLRRGQPVASLQGWGMNNGERTIAVSLRLPAGDGKYHQWQTGLMPVSAAAKHLRALAAEGVGVQTTKAAPPYRTHVVNTDESAARRLARLRYAAPAWWPRTGWGGGAGKEPITHEKVNAWLGKKDEKQLSANRKVWRDHTGDIHLRLHYTNIVTWHPDGSYTLNTGGWHSPTTARNMAAVIGLPVGRVNKRGQPPQLGVQGKPIVDGAKWESVMPPAPEQDYRPDSMLPEDHMTFGRKRKYARFSQLKDHPDLAAWHDALKADPGKKDIFADWVEEQGFPAMAGLMRQSWPPIHHDAAGPYDPAAEVQHRGQPTLVHFPTAGDRHGLSLFTVAKGGDRLHWHVTTDRLTAARLVRGLAAEGVGVVHRRTPLGRYGERVTNTDHSAAKRLSRLRYAQKKPRTADFLTAVRVLRGSGQKRLHAVAEDIARGLGLAPAKTRDALLDGPRGALPGVAQAVAGADPHTARYAAAWYGLLARTPSLGLFHVRPDGPDSLYKFHVRGSAHTARRVLDRHGIAARVLLPHGAGYDVVVPDPGRRMRANTLKAAGHLGGRVEESVGHLEPLGHADPAQARSAFRKIVERYEGGRR